MFVQVAFPFFVSFLLLFLIVILPLLLGIVLDAYAQQHARQRTLHRNKVHRLMIRYPVVRRILAQLREKGLVVHTNFSLELHPENVNFRTSKRSFSSPACRCANLHSA